MDLFHILNITIDQVMLRDFPMSLTGAASRWLRKKPTGSITTWEDLKTKFLSKYCPPARTAKKMEEINNFLQELDENLYQAWEQFNELLMKCPQHYLTEMQEVVLFYNRLDVPTRQILDSRGAIPSKTAADAKIAIQEMAEYSQKWHNGTSRVRSTEPSDGLAERGFRSPPSSIEVNPRDQVKSISTTIEADLCPIHRIRSSQYVVSTRQSRILMYETRQTTILFPSHLNGYYCEEKKGLYRPQFSEACFEASQSIPKRRKTQGVSLYLALLIMFASIMPLTVKYPKGIAENILVGTGKFTFPRVYMLSLRERMELNLEARLMGETLVINRSLDLLLEDYIELNDLNEPFKLRRNQGDDLMPTIEEGEVIEEFRTRDDELNVRIDD
ncbi:retrovirus-related pol polyprotein from transposon TNT 1-94 [Tanacetum coccineum]|uniref:Retrovirus-related pol polyprotein from transposon TNT 1-94 n=1 Tax=Tanacetum coccineum TaxID=301880 RepID=A0ABQ4XQ48_9ASTR